MRHGIRFVLLKPRKLNIGDVNSLNAIFMTIQKIHIGEHMIDFNDLIQKADAAEIDGIFNAVHNVAKQLDVIDAGYRLLMNVGSGAGQEVPHLHIHILSNKKKLIVFGCFWWRSDFYTGNPVCFFI